MSARMFCSSRGFLTRFTVSDGLEMQLGHIILVSVILQPHVTFRSAQISDCLLCPAVKTPIRWCHRGNYGRANFIQSKRSERKRSEAGKT